MCHALRCTVYRVLGTEYCYIHSVPDRYFDRVQRLHSMNSPQCFDAVVIGGGPAGATAALLLAEAGWAVALIEQKQFPRRKVCGEYLSATNWPLLTRLGI